MAPHFSTLAWKILWTEEPGRLQSMESLRVRHDWAIEQQQEGFPGGSVSKEFACNAGACRRLEFNPWVGKIPWRRK